MPIEKGPENRQGGIGLGDQQHKGTPEIARGDRAQEAMVSPTDSDPIGRVQYSVPREEPVAPQMVGIQGEATPDSAFGDLADVPARGSVWEALEDGPQLRSAEVKPDEEAVERARTEGYAPEPLAKNDIKDG